MTRVNVVLPFVPNENRAEFDSLFQEMNDITLQYNSIMSRIHPIQPDLTNYAECSSTVIGISPEVHDYCRRVLDWSNGFQSYELNLSYDYTGTLPDNFQFMGFKIMISNFVRNINRQSDTVLRSINDVWSSIQMQESLALTSSLVGKISKFAKHHPYFFAIEIIIHLAVIYVGLKELHIIKF